MAAPGQPGGTSPRCAGLDGLRGCAALVVVLYHLTLVPIGLAGTLRAIWPLRPLIAGPSAVYVFFTLSGFVLFKAYERERPGILDWVARRLLRLWPPVAAAVLLSAGLYWLVRPAPVPALSAWINNESWWQPPSAASILAHVALPGQKRFEELDNVIWSLVQEVRISLIFPLIAFAVRRRPVASIVAAAALAVAVTIWGEVLPDQQWFCWPDTARYLLLFVAGAALARFAGPLGRVLASPKVGLVALAIGTVLAAVGIGIGDGAAAAGGAVLLVAACAWSPPVIRVLARPVARWLGRVSYSLYLVHMPVLLALVHGLAGVLGASVTIVVALPASLAAAEFFHRFIEQPAIEASRRRAAALRRSPRHAIHA